MVQHRIFKSEADRPKPLAYVQVYPQGRRRVGGYLAAGVIGGVLTLLAAVALALIAGGMGGR